MNNDYIFIISNNNHTTKKEKIMSIFAVIFWNIAYWLSVGSIIYLDRYFRLQDRNIYVKHEKQDTWLDYLAESKEVKKWQKKHLL